MLGRVAGAVVGHERLRQPLADVRLAPDAGRLEVVDREAGDDGRQVGLRRLDGGAVGERPLVADERLLDDVLGLADARRASDTRSRRAAAGGRHRRRRHRPWPWLGSRGGRLLGSRSVVAGGGSGTGVSRPWRKPSRQLGQIGCQPSSRFAFAFDEPRPSVIIVTATSPASRRPSQAGIRSGFGAPSASAIAGMNSRDGAGSSSTML